MTTAAIDPAGEIAIRIAWDGTRVRRVNMRSTRPLVASRVLAGRRGVDAVDTVRLLFGVCRHAQHAAARAAIGAASDWRNEDAQRDERSVLLETLQEHVHHVLIDVPRASGRAAIVAAVDARKRIDALLRAIERDGDVEADAQRAVVAAVDAIATKEIYGMAPSEWLALDGANALRAWAARRATVSAAIVDELLGERCMEVARDVPLMPSADRATLLATVVPAMKNTDFARAPTWNGAAVETGALARTCDHPIVETLTVQRADAAAIRYVARMVELGVLLARLSDGSRDTAALSLVRGYALASDEGLAAVQTARGLLLHRARVAGERVTDYAIVAPTEWNFHPEGSAASALAGITAPNVRALERRAAVTVQAFDPCIAYRIEVADA